MWRVVILPALFLPPVLLFLVTRDDKGLPLYKSAMRSIFSSLAKENRVFLSDQINIENPKTKDFVDFLKKNELKEGLFIVDEISNNLSLASRNLPNVNVTNLNTLNPINLLKFNSVVIAENCLNLIEEKLS